MAAMTAAEYDEALAVLEGVRGEHRATPVGEEMSERFFGPVVFMLPGGWRVTAQNDYGEWEGVLEISAPDGRRWTPGHPDLCDWEPAPENRVAWGRAVCAMHCARCGRHRPITDMVVIKSRTRYECRDKSACDAALRREP